MSEIRLNAVRIGRMGWRVLHCGRIGLWKRGSLLRYIYIYIYICIDLIILMLDTTDEKKLGRDHHG
jgi:hypothetical protein